MNNNLRTCIKYLLVVRMRMRVRLESGAGLYIDMTIVYFLEYGKYKATKCNQSGKLAGIVIRAILKYGMVCTCDSYI